MPKKKSPLQPTLPFPTRSEEHLDTSTLETWLWDAACVIRGATDAPKYKDFILPLVFFKRLSDVFDDEFAEQVEAFGSEEVAHDIIKQDHEDALKSERDDTIVRFYIPQDYSWGKIRNHPANGKLGEFVTTAMREVARLNPDLKGVLDVKDYNERQSGQRTLDDEPLAKLIEVLSRHRLGLQNAEPDILGRAYEYLLRKFAEGQGQSAGEFYTPKEVGWLMAHLINPEPYSTVYDPTCGSGGLLIKARMYFEQQHPEDKAKAPKLYGQELNAVTYAMAKMNMFLHDYTDSYFAIGDTLRNPGFSAEGAGLKQFDYVVANPMWNQDNYDEAFYDQDKWNRFTLGTPTGGSADWGWIQHILASMNDTGRATIVLDTGSISRGSGSKNRNRERDIRAATVERDWVEGVILMPENMFYNTSAPGIIVLLNKCKIGKRKDKFLLINASSFFVKGKPKNLFTDEGISEVTRLYREWKNTKGLSRIIDLEMVRSSDYNISPNQYVQSGGEIEYRPLEEILNDLDLAKQEREEADAALVALLAKLGL